MKLRPSVLNLSLALALVLLCLSPVCVSAKALRIEPLHFESNEALATYVSENPGLNVLYIADSPGTTCDGYIRRQFAQDFLGDAETAHHYFYQFIGGGSC